MLLDKRSSCNEREAAELRDIFFVKQWKDDRNKNIFKFVKHISQYIL